MLLGFHGKIMGFYWDFMGFHGKFMEFHRDFTSRGQVFSGISPRSMGIEKENQHVYWRYYVDIDAQAVIRHVVSKNVVCPSTYCFL